MQHIHFLFLLCTNNLTLQVLTDNNVFYRFFIINVLFKKCCPLCGSDVATEH